MPKTSKFEKLFKIYCGCHIVLSSKWCVLMFEQCLSNVCASVSGPPLIYTFVKLFSINLSFNIIKVIKWNNII